MQSLHVTCINFRDQWEMCCSIIIRLDAHCSNGGPFSWRKRTKGNFRFVVAFVLVACESRAQTKKKLMALGKGETSTQLYQVLGVPVPVVYFCRGVIFFGCKIFLNFHVSPFERFLGIPRVCFRNMVLSSIFWNNFDTACDKSPFACWQRILRWTFGRRIWFTSWPIEYNIYR